MSKKIIVASISKTHLFINKSSGAMQEKGTDYGEYPIKQPRTKADAPALDGSCIDLMTRLMNGKPPYRSISLQTRYCTAALFLAITLASTVLKKNNAK